MNNLSSTIPVVAIQGYAGSFHEEAAQDFFGICETVACDSFRGLVQLVTEGKVDAGVMAIENSIAGSILPNYTLLQKNKVVISGEVYLHIKQHLMVNQGVALQDVHEVHSHPMALLQCMEWLEKYPQFKLVETEDTALSARLIHQHKSKHQAAIAGRRAAELYNMNIIAPNIHTMKKNYTRFLIILPHKKAVDITEANKASIVFETDHSRGSLAETLGIIASNNVNLSKLQSMPVPGTEFKYAFHADMEFGDIKEYHAAIEAMQAKKINIKVFGLYKNGKHNL